MKYERKIGKRYFSIGTHKDWIGLGFSISKYSIDCDLIFVYISFEF
jgi:hypothetical protein